MGALTLTVAACGEDTAKPPPAGPSCATTYGGCSINATCADTASGMTCTCREGYTGNGTTCTATSPVISSGDAHSCGVWPDNSLRCWGSNESGQLGDGSVDSASVPVTIGTAEWKSVAAGGRHTVAVKRDGSLWWWGWDYYLPTSTSTRRIP